METQSALSRAHPRVIVELGAAKAANIEMKRNIAAERAKKAAEDPTADTGIGFSVLRIGSGTERAAAEPETHTQNDTAQFL